MSIVTCADCQREVDLERHANSYCDECKKYFCFCLSSPCFTAYHRKHDLRGSKHTHLSITNPMWMVKLKSIKEKESE